MKECGAPKRLETKQKKLEEEEQKEVQKA